MFIAFEGLDGSGQTTQVEKLGAWFRQRGSSVVLTKEPTEESPFAALIRQVIRRKDIKLMPLTLQCLFIEDRRWHLKTVIEPALKEGKIVITDRYMFSTLAYGYAEALSIAVLKNMQADLPQPYLTFWLDVDSDVCSDRIAKRAGSDGDTRDYFERLSKLQAAQRGYRIIWRNHRPEGLHRIGGNRSEQEVFKEVLAIVQNGKF